MNDLNNLLSLTDVHYLIMIIFMQLDPVNSKNASKPAINFWITLHLFICSSQSSHAKSLSRLLLVFWIWRIFKHSSTSSQNFENEGGPTQKSFNKSVLDIEFFVLPPIVLFHVNLHHEQSFCIKRNFVINHFVFRMLDFSICIYLITIIRLARSFDYSRRQLSSQSFAL